jgi:hypothetical protein
MAMQRSDSVLANWLISQYGTSKPLCDRLVYAGAALGMNVRSFYAAMRYVEVRRLNPTGLGKEGGLHLAASRTLRAESPKLSAPERASRQGISTAQEIAVVSA